MRRAGPTSCFALCLAALVSACGGEECRWRMPGVTGEACRVRFSVGAAPIGIGAGIDTSARRIVHCDPYWSLVPCEDPPAREVRSTDESVVAPGERGGLVAVGEGRAYLEALDIQEPLDRIAVEVQAVTRQAVTDLPAQSGFAVELPARFAVPSGFELDLRRSVVGSDERLLVTGPLPRSQWAPVWEVLQGPPDLEALEDTCRNDPGGGYVCPSSIGLRAGQPGRGVLQTRGGWDVVGHVYYVDVVERSTPDEVSIRPLYVGEGAVALLAEPRQGGVVLLGNSYRWSLPVLACAADRSCEGAGWRPLRSVAVPTPLTERLLVATRDLRDPAEDDETFVVEVAGQVARVSLGEARRRFEAR